MTGFIFMKHKIKNIGFLLLLFLLPTVATAQSIKIKALFDSSAIVIGDQIKFRIEIDQPKNAKVQLPVLADTLVGKIEILKVFPADTSKKDQTLHIRKEYLITSFDSGYYKVAPLSFPFEMSQLKDTLKSEPVFLRVYSMPLDTAKDVRDIKPPLKAPFSLIEIWQYILIAFGLILIGFTIWYFIKKIKKEPFLTTKKTIEPPHIIAIRELDKLRAEKLWQTNKIKEYYTRLTEIIRVYIEKQFGIYALEMTSDEIVEALKKVHFEDEKSIELLRVMFYSADLVKFAKSEPLPDENEINLLNTYQFVNNTLVIDIHLNEPDAEQPVNSVKSISAANTGSPANVITQATKLTVKKKNYVLSVILWPKKIPFTYRIIILLFILGILSYQVVPDLIFNIKRDTAPSISFSELKKLAYGDIPRYFSISEAMVPSTSFVKITKKNRSGLESLKFIYYPVFSSGLGDSLKFSKAYVIVKDNHVTDSELNYNQYFKSGSFKIEGKFSGDRITSEIRKLFNDKGIQIESDAIILERNSEPWPLLICILIIIIGLLIGFWFIASFVPEIVFIRKFLNDKV